MEENNLINQPDNNLLNDMKNLKKYEKLIKICSILLMIFGFSMILFVIHYTLNYDGLITNIWDGNFIYLYVVLFILGFTYFTHNTVLLGFTTVQGKRMYTTNQMNFYIKATLFLSSLAFLSFINIYLLFKYLSLLNKVRTNEEAAVYLKINQTSKRQIKTKPLLFVYVFLLIGYIVWLSLTIKFDLINRGFLSLNTYYFLLVFAATFIFVISYFMCASLLSNTKYFLNNELVDKKWFIISAFPFIGALIYAVFYIKKGGLKHN
ncbi:hypothetical protein SHELI_v1c04730 [Spiroplasma helicoides]|uniref:Uncharacterized protein n=1 Tax=Spiroplasma helicoides TaxID=216938 RepID=A0A1B3SKH2_9MOLU|nr:hypothetical protein [Spiroplasma helicoides]AOG60424.1 hypothetical protein SHELI_v1c04730 [Spiroplasma helicoides]